jgi:hypothetical protein
MSAAGRREGNGVVAPRVFIVRAWRDEAGRLTGVVERVATGEKTRFVGAEALAGTIDGMTSEPEGS